MDHVAALIASQVTSEYQAITIMRCPHSLLNEASNRGVRFKFPATPHSQSKLTRSPHKNHSLTHTHSHRQNAHSHSHTNSDTGKCTQRLIECNYCTVLYLGNGARCKLGALYCKEYSASVPVCTKELLTSCLFVVIDCLGCCVL
jgi:hypothetical protein